MSFIAASVVYAPFVPTERLKGEPILNV